MSNPYYFRGAIHNPQLFFGRERLLRIIYSALIKKLSISLIGLPHSGKTSLLLQLARPQIQQLHFESDLSHHIFVLVNLSDCLNQSCDDFFEFVSKRIEEQCREKVALSHSKRRAEGRFSDILKQIVEQGYHTVLLIDAFDNVIRNKAFDAIFFSFLRSQANFWNYVSYVISSVAPLEELCHGAIEGSPFFEIFAMEKLVSLTFEEARALITEPAAQTEYSFTESNLSWILSLAGRHPYFIQRACHFLFEAKRLKEENGKIDLSSIQKQINDDLLPAFRHIHIVLKKQELGLKQPTQDRRELSESLLFHKYMQEVGLIQDIDLTLEELEQILSELSDSYVLGESRLRLLKIVSMQTKHIASPSSFDITKAIRTVLQIVLERMQGNGLRRDNSPDWMLYNILFYSYFKYRLKHHDLARKLNVSLSTYYRSRRKALKTFLAILIEMEAECDSGDLAE